MTARATFKQSDLDRALAVVERRGLQVARIDLNDNGASIVIGEPHDSGDDWRKGSPLYRGAA